MPGAAEMFARMTIFRIVTAPDMPTRAAQAQMHPAITAGQAFHAALSGGRNAPDDIGMGA